ncbi:LPXTG cell wall anchor domain-containing protein [Micromonospora carbonacea]|uniref:LPXTG cell wall anchor domain-containing protein n=1 Tax=Micromonospora carbonacea TaxID=47853 RepID=UPI003723D451
MLMSPIRRCLAGLGVAGVLVVASATPALAAPTANLDLYVQDATVAPDSPGTSRGLSIYTDRSTVLPDVTVRYDYRSLAGRVTLTGGGGNAECAAPEPGVLVCAEESDIPVDEIYGGGTQPVRIVVTDKAEPGDAGDLKVSLQVAGKDRGSYTSGLRVGEGVDLAGGPDSTLAAKPGGKFEAPLTVVNVGTKAVEGVVAVFDLDHSIRTRDRFSNCLYAEDHLIACQFDEEIPAGEGRTTTLDFHLGTDTYAPSNQYGNAVFMTNGDFEDLFGQREDAGALATTRGGGPKLTLADAPTKTARAAQTDTEPGNNYTSWSIRVSGTNGTDLQAIGDTVKGEAGAVVTATVGFRNNGPATLDRVNNDHEAATHTGVELPPGTTAVGFPDNCWLRYGSTRTYLCSSDMLLVVGETYTLEFRLRIDKVVPDARGVVQVNAECECPAGGSFQDDIKPANDKAWLVVNAAGSGGGGGGSLPITGSATGLIAGIGGLLLVAGIGGYLVARRRRTHFVA